MLLKPKLSFQNKNLLMNFCVIPDEPTPPQLLKINWLDESGKTKLFWAVKASEQKEIKIAM